MLVVGLIFLSVIAHRRADALRSASTRTRDARDLRDWIALLEREGELVRVTAEVDPDLEVTEIVDRTVKAGGPGAPLRESEGREAPAADQPVRHRAAHVPRVRRRARSTTSRARSSDVLEMQPPQGLDGQGARPAEAEVDRRLARDAPCAAGRCRRSCCRATTSTSALLPIQRCWPGDPAPFITLPGRDHAATRAAAAATSACTACR